MKKRYIFLAMAALLTMCKHPIKNKGSEVLIATMDDKEKTVESLRANLVLRLDASIKRRTTIEVNRRVIVPISASDPIYSQ